MHLQAAAVFSDAMVLQRGRDIPVWGRGREGSRVSVSFAGIRVDAGVAGGQWQVLLPPLEAGVRGVLDISDGETVLRFQNVVAGDVWLAGGQSNMELALPNCRNGAEELAACNNPDIRFYQAVKLAVVDEQLLRAEARNGWRVCRPDTAAGLSAVAWFFARKLYAETGVPIGIIGCNWGGSSVSAWMSEEWLAKSLAGQKYLDDYAALVGDKTDEQYDQELRDYFHSWNAWDRRVRARRAREPGLSWEILNRDCGECPWPQPAGRKSPFRPGNLYHAMICRLAPFALKGFLYYQGEEDANRAYAASYAELMRYLIDQWRTDWGDDSLPFLFVQLPMYGSRAEMDAGLSLPDWPILRENQFRVAQTVANTGMAVIIDRGEFDNIHPLDKQTVGLRLAYQALKRVYGLPLEADGPIYTRLVREGPRLRVLFAHTAGGLVWQGEQALSEGQETGFELAGSNGLYHPAQARIEGGGVLLSSPAVPAPERARYAWTKWGPAPLYARNGLPAMPFRSHRGDC